MVIAARSFLDLGKFKVSLRKDGLSSTLNHLDLTVPPKSVETEGAFPTELSRQSRGTS